MEETRVSDFSIDHILGPEVGPSAQKPPASFQDVTGYLPDGYFHGIPSGFPLDSGNLRPPAPVPVLGYMPYHGIGLGNGFLPYGAGFHHADFSLCPNSGVYRRFSQDAGRQPLVGYHGYQQPGLSAQAQQRQRARMRTVFTDSQTKQLEALFELTDYPAVEARAQVARSAGLSEETVRVWFKNRRARRKRQCSGSKVKSPSPPPSSSGSNHLFSSFL